MTALFIAAFCTAALAAVLTFPSLTGRVVDDAHILRADTIQTLTTELATHEQKTGEQIVVVTLPSLQGQEIEDYGYQLGRAWGIGQKGKNTGALIIVAPQERKSRIEVGYGLEGTLTDAVSVNIVQTDMLPAFRRGNYDDGVSAAVDDVLNHLGDNVAPEDPTPPQGAVAQDNAPLSPLTIFLIIAFVFFIISRLSSRRSGGVAPLVLGGLLGGGFGGGGGGFGSGGFSGGGGSFGGGGASGSW